MIFRTRAGFLDGFSIFNKSKILGWWKTVKTFQGDFRNIFLKHISITSEIWFAENIKPTPTEWW